MLAVEVPLRWGDMDAYGHINNVAVVRILEEARARGFWKPHAAASGALPPLEPTEAIWCVVSDLSVRYLAPLHYSHEPVTVHMSVTELRPATFTIAYDVRSPDGGSSIEASTRIVSVDRSSGSPRRLARESMDALRSLARS